MTTPPTFSSGAVLSSASMNKVGLWLVKTQAVGAVAVPDITVTGAFSADYDNYLILMSGGTASGACSMGIEIGGAVNNYYGFMNYGDSIGNVPLGAGRNNTALMNWVGGSAAAGQAVHVSVQVINPFKALYTKFLNGDYQNAGVYGTMQGEHRVATSYTSFRLVPDTGTISNGTVYVYGYKGTV